MNHLLSDARGFCIWFTGLPCSGKTTISRRLARESEGHGRVVTLLDADDVRRVLCPDLGYSDEDRLKSLMRLAFVAREVVRHRGIAIVAAISPREAQRQLIRRQFPKASFVQVWLSTPLAECERRDVKGMYAEARKGRIPDFTGVNAPYEQPCRSEIVCDTTASSIRKCVQSILAELTLRGAPFGETASAPPSLLGGLPDANGVLPATLNGKVGHSTARANRAALLGQAIVPLENRSHR
jgi:sulfate adenylyltransferase